MSPVIAAPIFTNHRPDGYARGDLVEILLGDRPTGITAHLPKYRSSRREYVVIPKDVLAHYEATGKMSKALRRGYYRAETRVDFQTASVSAMDA